MGHTISDKKKEVPKWQIYVVKQTAVRIIKTNAAARVISWLAESMRATVMKHAVKAFRRKEVIPFPVHWIIQARPSVLTAKQTSVCLTAITNVRLVKSRSREMVQQTVQILRALHLERNKKMPLVEKSMAFFT